MFQKIFNAVIVLLIITLFLSIAKQIKPTDNSNLFTSLKEMSVANNGLIENNQNAIIGLYETMQEAHNYYLSLD